MPHIYGQKIWTARKRCLNSSLHDTLPILAWLTTHGDALCFSKYGTTKDHRNDLKPITCRTTILNPKSGSIINIIINKIHKITSCVPLLSFHLTTITILQPPPAPPGPSARSPRVCRSKASCASLRGPLWSSSWAEAWKGNSMDVHIYLHIMYIRLVCHVK